jgi:MYXO-CTERM domain-containing protein
MTHWVLWMTAVAGVQLISAAAEAKNCLTVADCGGAAATCELTTYQTCAGTDPACPAGSPCGDKPVMDGQPGCAPYVEGLCRQPWELPCRADADCGVGFRCAEEIARACRGMGSTGGNGVPPSFTEECYETRTLACKLTEESCSTDADCEAGLRCLPSEASTCGHVWQTDETSQDASVRTPECAKVPMLCAPAGYFGDLPTSARADDDMPSVERSGAGGTFRGDAGATALDEAEGARHDDGGCSLSSTPAAHSALWLALGMLAFERRRRVARERVERRGSSSRHVP